MLDLIVRRNSIWTPPETDDKGISLLCEAQEIEGCHLIIKNIEPYVDAIYVQKRDANDLPITKRFVFHEGFYWNHDDEAFFVEYCVNNPNLMLNLARFEDIYEYYNNLHPEWHLKRYYTKPVRLLDHIHHCQMKYTAKEMLYKAGLDELAAHFDEMDEYDMLATSLKDIYEGLSARTLRALNCRVGATLVADHDMRVFLKGIQNHFNDAFKDKLNDASCSYLLWLKKRDLTYEEAGRLLLASKSRLAQMWAPTQYRDYLLLEKNKLEMEKMAILLGDIDGIFMDYLRDKSVDDGDKNLLKQLLIEKRSEYDRKLRASNRKRPADWQERDHGYVVRFPQTVSDFCREAAYNRHCLMGYIYAVMENESTVLFMRKADDVNRPFITLEVYENKLVQARHKYNYECSHEEDMWIIEYCKRHGIDFDEYLDSLIED